MTSKKTLSERAHMAHELISSIVDDLDEEMQPHVKMAMDILQGKADDLLHPLGSTPHDPGYYVCWIEFQGPNTHGEKKTGPWALDDAIERRDALNKIIEARNDSHPAATVCFIDGRGEQSTP